MESHKTNGEISSRDYNHEIRISTLKNGNIILRNNKTMKVSLQINADANNVKEIAPDVLLLNRRGSEKSTIITTRNMTCLRDISLLEHKVISDNLLYINCGKGMQAFIRIPSMQTTGWLNIASYKVVNKNLILLVDPKGHTRSLKPWALLISGNLSVSDIALLCKQVVTI